MFGISHFGFFVVAVLLLNLTPGPDIAYIVGRSVAQGRKAGLVSAWGISTGCCVHVFACAFGLTALLAASATAFTFIKIAGALYLIYLGIRLVFAKQPSASEGTLAVAGAEPSLRALFLQGFWTNVLNPKVVLFFVAFFPQFVAADSPRGQQTLAFLTLGAVFVGMSTIWDSFIAWVAGSVAQRVAGRRTVKAWVDRGVGITFVSLGCKLALMQR